MPKLIARLEKSTPPSTLPIGGITTLSTSEETILPKAAPMITPTARSTTLPLLMNSRNSFTNDIKILRIYERTNVQSFIVTAQDRIRPPAYLITIGHTAFIGVFGKRIRMVVEDLIPVTER